MSPTTRTVLRRPTNAAYVDLARSFLGFGLIGLANTILPFIVFASNYLIVPYPRPVVLIIEILPALAIKLLLPQLLRHYRIPQYARPLTLAACWVLTRIVTATTPPNIPPPVRILMSMLASATAASTDVFALGLLRHYGQVGLAGWGFGTGMGGMACAYLPLFLTVWSRGTLRDGIGHIPKLTFLMVVAYLVVLPRISPGRRRENNPDAADDAMEAEGQFILLQAPATKSDGLSKNYHCNVGAIKSLIKPYMLPLAISLGMQAVIYPGVARALGTTEAPDFLHYKAWFGLIFHLGNTIGRTLIVMGRYRRPQLLQTISGVGLGLVLIHAYFLMLAWAVMIAVFTVGLTGGIIYANTFAAVMDDIQDPEEREREFALGITGAGDSGGTLVGSLAGAALESMLCSSPPNGTRWCHKVR